MQILDAEVRAIDRNTFSGFIHGFAKLLNCFHDLTCTALDSLNYFSRFTDQTYADINLVLTGLHTFHGFLR